MYKHNGIKVVNPKLSAGIKHLKAQRKNGGFIAVDEYEDISGRILEIKNKDTGGVNKVNRSNLTQEELEGWGLF